jgi:putative alpha-1,2-mannosidase
VQSLEWNGERFDGVTIKYDELMQGGILHFVMGKEPPVHDEL